tara:strand:- start:612 stop:971 length:360 start_codon:yes stop_codon:yes gene_type:complete
VQQISIFPNVYTQNAKLFKYEILIKGEKRLYFERPEIYFQCVKVVINLKNVRKWRILMRYNKEIMKMMTDSGFYLARKNNHNIWKNSDGMMIVASSSPSCPYTLIKLKRRINKTINKSM